VAELGAEQVMGLHDALYFQVPQENATAAAEEICRVMSEPLEGIDGVDWGCPLGPVDAEVGPNLGNLQSI